AGVAIAKTEGGELLYERVHEDARAILAQQGLVRECAQHRERRSGDRTRGLGRETPAKSRQPRQLVALAHTEQSPRLVEYDLDARVPSGVRSIDGVQKLGSMTQLGGDRIPVQHPR